MNLLRLVLACAICGLIPGTGTAQSWPSRPVRVVVPYPAGGVVDVVARAICARLSSDLGQPFVIESKPGANANIGAEAVATAPADGHTLLVSAPFIINNPLLETGLRWHPRDLMPIARFATASSYFVVPVSSQAKSLKEFVTIAKARPGLQYGDVGAGSTQTMATEMFRASAGISLEPVLYKGGPQLMPDLINGLISIAVSPASLVVPLVTAGKLRALANASDRRSQQLPDVPTVAESGYPDATVISWFGFHAPAATPASVTTRVAAATRTAASSADVLSRFAAAGGDAYFQGGAEFEAFLRTEAGRWESSIRMFKR
jgi:tripartite-type tricarboxylate transporter receptor subunit TctC